MAIGKQYSEGTSKSVDSQSKNLGQVQCPNCGGYKVGGLSNQLFKYKPLSGVVWSIILLFFIPFVIGSYGLGLIILIDVNIREAVLNKRIREKYIGIEYNFTCSLCGCEWSWKQGQPWPKIEVRPDLIAAGEQRLADEAKQRLRDAEGAFWLSQHRK
jgi:hypothetical protein